jgi:hypothetical protein
MSEVPPPLSGGATTTTTTTTAPTSGRGSFEDVYNNRQGNAGGTASAVDDFIRALQQGGSPDLNMVLDAEILVGHGYQPGIGTARPERRTVRDLLDEARQWDEQTLRQTQQMMWDAGYYDGIPGIKSVEDVQFGSYDRATRMAYSDVLSDAILYPDKSIGRLLADGKAKREEAESARAQAEDDERDPRHYVDTRPARIGGANVYTTRATDPSLLRKVASAAAVAVMGRGLTPEDKDKIASVIMEAERAEDRKVNAAQEGAQRALFDAGTGAADAHGHTTAANRAGTPTGRPQGQNGRLGNDQLVAVGNGHRLAPGAAEAFKAMQAAAAADGVSITLTDSYRDYDSQVKVRRDKGHKVATATPGTSNHGWGMAIDINMNKPGVKTWLDQNAHRYGYVNPDWAKKAGKSHEPWHWEYGGGGGTGVQMATARGDTFSYGGPSSPDTYLPSHTVDVTGVHAESRAKDMVREMFPDEAGAHDIVGAYSRMRSLMTGIAGPARIG